VRLLHDLGYTDVRHYAGGLAEWESGGETVADTPRAAVHVTRSMRFIDALADRNVGELFRLWIGIVFGFAMVYWLLDAIPGQELLANGAPVTHDVRGFFSAVYFSAVTATSVGYGDIVPRGVERLLAIVESAAGLVIFGCVVSKFVSRRQEQLIGEIHRIAFEDRLGRVRTNLHLVRTELSAIAALCHGHEQTPPAALGRIESIAMIFLGELHVVHDLLYRPQDQPEESAFEAILASLASVFRELNEVVHCLSPGSTARTAALGGTFRSMSRLAREICGDCVPRQHAPALRAWMDQIQAAAADIEAEAPG
jgi:potassium channel LctB